MHLSRNLLASAILLAIFNATLPAQTGIITTVAGNGQPGTAGVGGLAVNAQIVPTGIVVDSADNIFIADSSTNRVIRVDGSSGIVTLVAGTGVASSSGDGGLATQASLNAPRGVTLDSTGNLYILEFVGNRVRRVDASTGIITTVAGTGLSGFNGDGGPATNATLSFPFGIVLDAAGNLYIADAGNVRVRRVSAQTGIITTVAGNGTTGFSPDGTAAANASFSLPFTVSLDREGNLLIPEFNNARIRRIDAFLGTLSTVAGDGVQVFTGDGVTALNAGIGKVAQNVVTDTAGNLFFADGTGRIRRVDAATGVITTVAGNGSGAQGQSSAGAGGGSGGCLPTIGDNGPATSATIDGAYAVALTSNGHLLISDGMDCRVRRVALPSPLPYTNTTLSVPTSSAQGQPVTLVATVTPIGATGTPTGSIQFLYQPQGLTPVVLGMAQIVNGSASITISGPTSNGSYPIVAYYSGDSQYNASGSPAMPIVVTSLQVPTVSLTVDQNPIGLNATTNFTVTVAPPSGNTLTPTGSVRLSDSSGSMPPQTATLTSGSVQFHVAFTVGGTHPVTATYLGDSNYNQAFSSTLNETVKSASSVALLSDRNPAAVGSTFNLGGFVTPQQATGTVVFTEGATTLGTATVVNGFANLPVSTLTAGTHYIQAAYSGDSSFMPSTSTILTQTIINAPTVTITANPVSSIYGTPVTFSATVSPSNATGTVNFSSSDPTDPWGLWTTSMPLSGGQVSITVPGIYVGTHSIAATYNGDGTYASATSMPVTITVAKATPVVTLTSATNPSMQGQSVSYTVTVSPASTGALVNLYDGASMVGGGNLLNSGSTGTVTISITLPTGGHPLTAVCNSNRDLNSATSSPALIQTVQQNTVVNFQSSPGPFVYGQPITFTASLNSPNATGTVQFSDGATSLGIVAITNTVASITVSSLSAGPHTITAAYSGDGYYLPSTGTMTITVSKAAASVALTSSLNPSVAGQAVTLSAAVSPSTATGSVQFLDGSTVLGTATVSAGTASLNTSALAGGTHSITAVYSGDSNYAGVTSAATIQVVKAVSTTSVVSDTQSPAYGQTINLIATVTPTPVGGTVQFLDGAVVLGTANVAGGVATLPISTLVVGAHTITAAYSGDASDTSSTSAAITLTIVKANTTVTLASSLNPATVGQAVTFTAAVSPAAATGSVQFLDGATVLSTAAVSGGAASITTSALGAGSHSITAVYSGDTSYTGSTSAAVSQTVNKAATTVVARSTLNPSTFSQAVILTASVTPNGATGTVQFLDGSTVLGTATLSGGAGSITTSTLAAGSHSITAVYGGDGSYLGSTSAVLTQTVNKAPSALTLASSQNPTGPTVAITFTASLTHTPSSATGSVQFLDGSTVLGTVPLNAGSAALTTSSLAAGNHTITAVYSGDVNFSGSSASLNQSVLNSTSTSLTADQTSTAYGQTITFTATVSPSTATGTVTFVDAWSVIIGSATLSGGQAKLTIATLPAGRHSITAGYGGDAANFVSSSAAVSVTVAQVKPTITVTGSPDPAAVGQTVTLTATLSSTAATGTVAFRDGSQAIGTATVSNGVAVFSTTSLAAGNHSITAVYSGDNNYTSATSKEDILKVK